MPITDAKFKRLSADNVARAPRETGVFALYAHNTLVYLGSAVGPDQTIRSQLLEHVDQGQAKASGATRYKRETTTEPQARLDTLLLEYRDSHGGTLPRGNARH
jgi:hypothetical protein